MNNLTKLLEEEPTTLTSPKLYSGSPPIRIATGSGEADYDDNNPSNNPQEIVLENKPQKLSIFKRQLGPEYKAGIIGMAIGTYSAFILNNYNALRNLDQTDKSFLGDMATFLVLAGGGFYLFKKAAEGIMRLAKVN